MKKIVVEMTYDVDIIEVPDDIEKNIKKCKGSLINGYMTNQISINIG